MRRLRQAASRGACFVLLVCLALAAVGTGQVSMRALRSGESESSQSESEQKQQEELVAHPERANSTSRRLAPCAVTKVNSSRVAAAAACRATCDDSPSGHRLPNGLLAPLRC